MRRLVTLVIAAALLLPTAAAHAGAPIKKLGTCSDSYLFYSASASKVGFRAAIVCLVNAARKAERLPALKPDARLASVAQSQSDKFARTGSGSHGRTLAEIGKRFERKGYRPAAYNEAFSFVTAPGAPYLLLAEMMRQKTVPCSEILDPRFRDIGVGVSTDPTGSITTLALEFGLKRGAKQPSNDYSKSLSCPHKVPVPILDGPPIAGAQPIPTAHGDTVSAGLHCTANVDCVLTATLQLAHNGATAATPGPVTIPAGTAATLTFSFDPAAIQDELAQQAPGIQLTFTTSKPVAYSDVFDGPLHAG